MDIARTVSGKYYIRYFSYHKTELYLVGDHDLLKNAG